MSRLIDADALHRAMYHEAFETDSDMQKWDSGCWIRYKMFEKAIENAPTIEAEPVRHGRWIPVDSYSAFGGSEEAWRAHGNPTAYHYCSECKEQSRLDEFGNEILSKYCLNCGAKMDGEE